LKKRKAVVNFDKESLTRAVCIDNKLLSSEFAKCKPPVGINGSNVDVIFAAPVHLHDPS
jgi:hypothetical protein